MLDSEKIMSISTLITGKCAPLRLCANICLLIFLMGCQLAGRNMSPIESQISNKDSDHVSQFNQYVDDQTNLIFRLAAVDVESIDEARAACTRLASQAAPFDWKLIETPKHVVFMGDNYLTQYGSRKIVRGTESLCGRLVAGQNIPGLTDYRLEEETGKVDSARVFFANDGDKYGSQVVASFRDGFVCKIDWVYQVERLIHIEALGAMRKRHVPVGDALCVSEVMHPTGYKPRHSSPTTDPADIAAREDYQRRQTQLLRESEACEAGCNQAYRIIMDRKATTPYLELELAVNRFGQCMEGCRRSFDKAVKESLRGSSR